MGWHTHPCLHIVLGVRPVAQVICLFLPHGMRPTCKLLTFLNLRLTCRAALPPVTGQMAYRVVLLMRHRVSEIVKTAKKVKDSGFLLQCWMPGQPLQRLAWDRRTGIPKGMSQEWWDANQQLKRLVGWTVEGKLEL